MTRLMDRPAVPAPTPPNGAAAPNGAAPPASVQPAVDRFSADNPNLDIWRRNEATDAWATKAFQRGGGFKGTATNATYIVKRLTAEFGPAGIGWGIDVLVHDLLTGAPICGENGSVLCHELVDRVQARFWWVKDGKRGEFAAVGQTVFVGHDKRGLYTDEEAPKKSVTDALSKAASWLGFAADIHLGLWDDSRYVAERRAADNGTAKAPTRSWRALFADLQRQIEAAPSRADVDAIASGADAGLVRQKGSDVHRAMLDKLLDAGRARFNAPRLARAEERAAA